MTNSNASVLFTVRLALPLALCVMAGCAQELDLYEPPAGRVQAQFDPASTPVLAPTPNDLNRDAVTGRLTPTVPACALLRRGPYTDLTAGATAAVAPLIKVGINGAYRVKLNAGSVGHLQFSADAAGALVLYMDRDLPLKLQDERGVSVTVSRSEKGIVGCSTQGARHQLYVAAKGRYTLGLGPAATAASVYLTLVQDTATLAYNRYLSTLDGHPAGRDGSVAEMTFSGTVDSTSLTPDTVLGFDVTTLSSPTKLGSLILDAATVSGGSNGRTRLRVWSKAGFSPGKRHAFFVLGGKKGVHAAAASAGATGLPVMRSPMMELAMGTRPICVWDSQRSWDPVGSTCAAPASGSKTSPTGCCTHNHATLLQRSVEAALRKRADIKALTLTRRERAIKAEVLARATTLERLRQQNRALLKVAAGAGVKAEDVVLIWSFTTASMNQALFDPAASPPSLPLPTDLHLDSVTGLLKVPTLSGATAADLEWTTYLNTLDGFPVDTPASLSFSAELDSASAGSKGILVATLPASGTPAAVTGAAASYDATRKRLSISRPAGWARGTSHAVLALAGKTGLKNKVSKISTSPRPSTKMAMVMSRSPLCTWDNARAIDRSGDCTPASGSLATGCCTKVLAPSILDDPKLLTGAKTALAKATALERIRRQYDPALRRLEAAGLVARHDVAAMWSFTTTSLSEMNNSLSAGGAPWPNDLHLDSKTGKLSLPAPAKETAAARALRLGLNGQDGFSIQGQLLAGFTGSVASLSLIQGTSYYLFDLDAGQVVADKITASIDSGTLVLSPSLPLDEETTYGVVLLSDLLGGSTYSGGGLWDSLGQRVAASPLTALVRARSQLYKGGKSLVSHLDATTAKKAEAARVAAKPLLSLVDKLSLDRTSVVGAWTFTTGSFTDPATRLRASAYKALGKLDGLAPTLTGTVAAASTIDWGGGSVEVSQIGGWISAGAFASLGVLGSSGGGTLLADPDKAKPVSVGFTLTLPKGAAPAKGFPVALFQHGLFRQRQDMVPLANAMAKAGLATVAFDLVHHGDRAWCTSDSHCDSGTCDTKTGTCKGGKLKDDKQGIPLASGARLHDLIVSDPVAARDSMYQNQVDAVALLRALLLGAEKGLKTSGGQVKLDASRVSYLGHSLGAMLGPLVLATDGLPSRAVLTAPGAPLSELFYSSTSFTKTWVKLLKAHGVTSGSAGELRLKAALQQVFDPVDPGSFARYMRLAQLPDRTSTAGGKVLRKQLMIQLAAGDTTVPYKMGTRLAGLAGLTSTQLYRTTYFSQGHSFLIEPDPKGTTGATRAAQIQAATFLSAGTVCWPDILAGTCK